MRYVETDVGDSLVEEDERTTPPRPEHRRVHVSLLLTVAVLVGTVVAIYSIFPKRDNVLFKVSAEEHLDTRELILDAPSDAELVAWATGLFDIALPIKEIVKQNTVVGARSTSVLNRKAAVMKISTGEDLVTLLVLKAFDAPPRDYRAKEADLALVTWRHKGWTLVAVGELANEKRWLNAIQGK